MAEYPRNALFDAPIDPQFYRYQGRTAPNALYGTVTPDSRAGRMPDSYGAMSNPAERPGDWAVTSGLAETLSPIAQGYGAGQMAGDAWQAAKAGDYGSAAGGGLMAAMSMLPMKKGAAPIAAAERPAGIRAYHGSPHDFDKFDTAKIGTGEGAQAYGHGLYFAEQEATAKSYRDQLTGSGKRMNSVDTQAKSIFDANGGDVEKSVAAVDAMIAQAQKDGWTGAVPEMQQWQDRIKRGGFDGRMYEVNINADPEHFLDWDKPLKQQSEKVRQSVDSLNIKDLDYHLGKDDRGGFNVMRALKNHTGQGNDVATQALKEAGVPGIKYLDQGSRGAGEGSRNYVVFDPATIEIMRKYGLLGPMAGGVGMNALYGNNDQ